MIHFQPRLVDIGCIDNQLKRSELKDIGLSLDAPLADFSDIDAHRPELLGYAKRLANDATWAEDLVQETFLKAFANREKFTPGTNRRA